MRKRVLSIALLFSGAALAETATATEQTHAICGGAAALFASGEHDRAYESLLPYWPLPKEEIQNLGCQTKTQMGMVGDRFGQPLGAEHVETISAGNSLVKHVFLIKHEKHALKFSCVFYKPKDSWLVNIILWDDKPHTLVGIGG
ncbi:MAG TPA: hypothetical protein VIG97_09395 [Luteimonas sp.]